MYYLALIVGLCQCITHDWLFDITHSVSTNLLLFFTDFNGCYLLSVLNLLFVICHLWWLCIAIICYQHLCYLLFIVVIMLLSLSCPPLLLSLWFMFNYCDAYYIYEVDAFSKLATKNHGKFWYQPLPGGISHVPSARISHAWVYACMILKLDLLSTLQHNLVYMGNPLLVVIHSVFLEISGQTIATSADLTLNRV